MEPSFAKECPAAIDAICRTEQTPYVPSINSLRPIAREISMPLRILPSTLFFLHLACASFAGEMDGEWLSIARVRAGAEQPGAATKAVIAAGVFRTERDGTVQEQGIITESAGSDPHRYTVEMKGDVQDAGKTFHGIFRVAGDTMITCANPAPGGAHPTGFASTKDNGA